MNAKGTRSGFAFEILNPRGVLHSLPISGLTNPRPRDLAGKRIALMSEKLESLHFFDALEELLKKQYPTATILRLDSPANPMRPDNTAEVAAKCDVWLQGVKTSGSSVVDYDVKMEKLGKPGAPFCIDSLLPQRKRLAEVNGMPTLRIITIPSLSYLGAEGYPERMKPVAASVFDATIKALTSPLTEEEKNPKPPVFSYGPLQFAGNSYTEAVEKFQQYCIDHCLGDGLPVIPPTREAVDWMLTGTSRSPGEEIGLMAPRNGMATIEKIAINAVMSGAKPEYLPVIIAAIECVTEECFNLYHLSTSTASPTPIIWVNGPIAEEIGMNSGMGYLGRGCRANNSIGRAIGLCLINIGWRLMDADSGVVGDPEGFCNFTFAENDKESPWKPFAVDCGYGPEESTVTVNETMSYNRLGPGGGMSSQTMEQSLEALAGMLQGPAGAMTRLIFAKGSRYQLALNPTLARELAEAGFTQKSLAEWLYQKTCITWDQLSGSDQEMIKAAAKSGMVPWLKPEDCKTGLVFPAFGDPKHLAILVAGDAAANTVLWSSPVGSTNINPDLAESFKGTPVAFMTKAIRGAALTRAGRSKGY
jgi:hypothetical protein